MNKKKICALIISALVPLSLFSCGDKTDESGDDTGNTQQSESDSAKGDKSDKKEQPPTEKLEKKEQIFADYLNSQKLCSINKSFNILEAGAVKDNPIGLAGAVQFDFDNDKDNEVITFTFDRNNENGEDIRIDLLKLDGKNVKVIDSRYMTELLDLDNVSSDQRNDTIYFANNAQIQIVTSEYNNNLYFGCMLNEAPLVGGICNIYSTASVFTVEDGKISVQMTTAIIDSPPLNLVYSKLLPPTLRNKTIEESMSRIDEQSTRDKEEAESVKADIDSYTTDVNKYNVFLNARSFNGDYHVEGGLFSTEAQAFSGLLNEFGLDFETAYTSNASYLEFISKNQSVIKTIIKTEQVRPLITKNQDYSYIGVRLILDSDLEKLMQSDNIFYTAYENELSLYEDIMKYPHYYHEVWDYFSDYKYSVEYCTVDIDSDGKYELILKADGYAVVVKPDLTVYSMDDHGDHLEFYNNGVISSTHSISVLRTYYLDVKTGEKSESAFTDMMNKEYLWFKSSDGTEYTDTEDSRDAKKNYNELLSGSKLELSFAPYYISRTFEELVVTELSDVTITWQKEYTKIIKNMSDWKFSLIYIDDDDVPELYAVNDDNDTYVYTYGNSAYIISMSFSSNNDEFKGYIEKSGVFVTYESGGRFDYGYDIHNISDNIEKVTDTLRFEMGQVNSYKINDKDVTESEFNSKYEEYEKKFTPITVSTASEILRLINGDEAEELFVDEEELFDDDIPEKDTAKVKAGGGLNMRSGAGKEFEKITLIPDGSEVEVVDSQGDWTKVKYKDYVGWVSSDYLF